jgi:hypothetical protein
MEPQPSSKTQGSQKYNNHLVVRTPLYRHTTIIAHECSPNKIQRRNCTAALQHLEVWPPSKGMCLPSESPKPAREEEGACVWHNFKNDLLKQIVPGLCGDEPYRLVNKTNKGELNPFLTSHTVVADTYLSLFA